MNCCADPYTDCTTRPNCGCYLNATDPRGGASAAGWLEKEYAEVCPTSEFGSLKMREEACSVPQDGQLGSIGLVAFLIGGLSMLSSGLPRVVRLSVRIAWSECTEVLSLLLVYTVALDLV